MRIPTTRTQVTRKKYGSILSSGLLLGLLAGTVGFGASTGEQASSWRDPLVRLVLKYETSGVFHEGSLLHSKVIEHTEFQGIVVDARGYILSYVGDHWPKMGKPQSRLVVQFSDGKSESAHLVGVDERINVALVESVRAARREATGRYVPSGFRRTYQFTGTFFIRQRLSRYCTYLCSRPNSYSCRVTSTSVSWTSTSRPTGR